VEGIIRRDADSGWMKTMTIEVEVKSRIDDIGAFERRLREAGARRMKDVVENDTYYSHPCRSFVSTDEALRIRLEGKRADLTYKGPKLDKKSKSREEMVIPLDGPEGAENVDAMLQRLGFSKVACVRKRRRVYLLGKFEVCVDRVERVGNYAELESRVPKKNYARVLEEALALLDRLGGKELERRSYLEMLLARREPKKRVSR
jgi:adenylate cyclase class 2